MRNGFHVYYKTFAHFLQEAPFLIFVFDFKIERLFLPHILSLFISLFLTFFRKSLSSTWSSLVHHPAAVAAVGPG
jgi:hypothetical protein